MSTNNSPRQPGRAAGSPAPGEPAKRPPAPVDQRRGVGQPQGPSRPGTPGAPTRNQTPPVDQRRAVGQPRGPSRPGTPGAPARNQTPPIDQRRGAGQPQASGRPGTPARNQTPPIDQRRVVGQAQGPSRPGTPGAPARNQPGPAQQRREPAQPGIATAPNDQEASRQPGAPSEIPQRRPVPSAPEVEDKPPGPIIAEPNPKQPIFTHPHPQDDNFLPFYDQKDPVGGRPSPEVMAQDQIRRSELTLQRPLTTEEKEVIHNYFKDMSYKRVSDEMSKPTKIHPPRKGSESAGDSSVDDSTTTASESPASASLDRGVSSGGKSKIPDTPGLEPPRSSPLLNRIAALEVQTKELEQRLSSKQKMLEAVQEEVRVLKSVREEVKVPKSVQEDVKVLQEEIQALRSVQEDTKTLQSAQKEVTVLQSVHEDMKVLQQEYKAIKEKLYTLEKGATAANKSEPSPDAPRMDTASLRQAEEQLVVRGFRATWGFRLRRLARDLRARIMGVILATMVLVWIVTEAMLHSKRLSDGYGTFINAGFNGLGGALVFGTWKKFFVFVGVLLYLGYFSIRGVVGR